MFNKKTLINAEEEQQENLFVQPQIQIQDIPKKKTLVLEYDDFHWKYPEDCLETIRSFVKRIPNIKLSLFTTALHSGRPLSQEKAWVDEVRSFIEKGNIVLAVHGCDHSQEEFKYLTEDDVILKLERVHKEFETANLPFVKVFRGPHWGINQNTYNALSLFDYSHVYTHRDYEALALQNSAIKNVFYNWNLKDETPVDTDLIIGHGHSHDVCGNGIRETFDKVVEFIEKNNPDFKFVNEV